MSKLVLYTELETALAEGGSKLFPCALDDRSRFADQIGEPVLIANIGSELASGFVALGALGSFQIDSLGHARAQIDDLRVFPVEVPFFDASASIDQIQDLSDDVFGRVIDQATGSLHAAEKPMQRVSLVSRDRFSTELATLYRNRCSFSDVRTYDGAAYMIRPIDQGGSWSINNFLFLDPEPGDLFASFAWAVGPKFQIIIDADAVSANISDTVNRTGMLALPENTEYWPDRAALSWHLEQFNKRLGSSGR